MSVRAAAPHRGSEFRISLFQTAAGVKFLEELRGFSSHAAEIQAKQFTWPRVRSVLQRSAICSAASGATFYASATAMQGLFGGLFRVSASTPVLAPVCGGVAFIISALSADLAARTCIKIFFTHAKPQPERRKRKRRKQPETTSQQPVKVNPIVPVAVSFGMFLLLGGRLRSFLPSNVLKPGAFHRRLGSISGSSQYASKAGKELTQEHGAAFGCHTCGIVRSQFWADHMPPKAVVAARAKGWARKFFESRRVNYRMYPQCRPCSSIQSATILRKSRKLIYHYNVLRRYHLTGLSVGLMQSLFPQ
ncbi:hypothetical protein NDN08_006516 [Rhodosorus marinus]|uniref:Zinc-binding domain-containing protein n=1 Tax=Rhodosorus marinus TaxID=101924 RepID=A0AAV8ULX5_9RHOD|nr:hypothetical protein NDN08_006516 [Rhodosorus marinus]